MADMARELEEHWLDEIARAMALADNCMEDADSLAARAKEMRKLSRKWEARAQQLIEAHRREVAIGG